jgi:uncharacterized protein DUF4238
MAVNITRRSHVVPAFYLRNFVRQGSNKLWVRDLKTGNIHASTPTKAGTMRDYYRGAGARHEDDLESRLGGIESDAAPRLRHLFERAEVMPELARFIPWLAARTEWVRRIYQHGLGEFILANYGALKEKGGDGGRELPFLFVHTGTGEKRVVELERAPEYLRDNNWSLRIHQDQFLDCIRIQAHIFATDLFPRMKWIKLTAPSGYRFITADRPVFWDGLDEQFKDQPSALRHPDVKLIVPLSTSFALLAGHDLDLMFSRGISVGEVNRLAMRRAERFLYAADESDLASKFSGKL